jgi:putative ABC transport system permease protein
MELKRAAHIVRLRLRSIFHRAQSERDLDEEIRYHIDRLTDQYIAQGMESLDARQAAIRTFQGVQQRKEECLDAWGVRFLESLVLDLRHGLRNLGKNPGFALVAVLTIALGIGANTTIFTLLDPILFRALAYSHPSQLVRVHRTSPQSDSWPHSVPNFLDYRTQNNVFSGMAAFTWTSFNMADPGEASERVQGLAVTFDFFPLLDVQPVLGRVFTEDEDRPGAETVVVISNRFWKMRFGGDRKIVGRSVRFNGRGAKIIGVMPDSFENPLFFGRVDVWAPLAFTDNARQNRATNFLSVVARLKNGVVLAQAESELASLADRLHKEHGESDRREGIHLVEFKTSITTDTLHQVSWFTFCMTVFVLLIACANLANLQLARTTRRTREFALRAALGGGQRRLIKQSLTESLVISLLGCAVALPASIVTTQIVAQRVFSEVPGARLAIDYRFFAFAFLCSLIAGVVFGAVPAWLASRSDLNELMKAGPRNASASRSQHRLRNGLIVAEVAFALMLLAGAAVFIRGLRDVMVINPGWHVDGVLIGRIGLDSPNYARPPQQVQFFNRLQQQLAALPGVKNAAISSSPPTWIFHSSSDFRLESPGAPTILANHEIVSPQYFETLEIPLKEGRTFTSNDRFGQTEVAIINEAMARKYWPNESAVGKRFLYEGDPQKRWREIVGVVGNVRFPSTLRNPDADVTVYRPIMQAPVRGVHVELRTAGAPEALIPAVRRVAAELDKDQPIFELRTARDFIQNNVAGLDLAGTLLSAFSVLGLVLAAVGIFGVISYSVTQRTSEIGIRMALGAERRQVRALVLRQGLIVTLGGALIGFAGAGATTRILATAIPGLPVGGSVTLLGATALLLFVASLACYLPAHRASKVDPMVALRHE